MKRNKGFTLVEVLVVLAILAIMIAIAIPAYRYMSTSADKTVCTSHLRDADTLYQIKRAVRGTSDAEQIEMMGEVLVEAFQATETAEGFTGVCPSGGVYVITVQDSVARVTCLKHQTDSHEQQDPYTPYAYIQMLLDIDAIELKDAKGNVVSTGSILDYLEWKTAGKPNGTTVSLDSEADHLGDKGIARQIENYLNAAYPQADFDTNSWRIYYRKGSPGEYTISWTGEDISHKNVGDTISVIRYDINKKEYTMTSTATVGEKVEEGQKIKYMNISSITDWVVVEEHDD